MPSTLRPLESISRRVIAVIGLVLVEHVAQRVPMRGALHAQHQRVVGIADLVPVLPFGHRVGAGRQHLVDRIETAAEQAVLRALGVERNAERKNLAGADQARSLDDVLRRDLIERSDLVVLAPAAPVPELLRRLGDRLPIDLDIHLSPSLMSHDFSWRHSAPRMRLSLAQIFRIVRGIIMGSRGFKRRAKRESKRPCQGLHFYRRCRDARHYRCVLDRGRRHAGPSGYDRR